MQWIEYLQLVKVVRMLYGHQIAKQFFEKNTTVMFPQFVDKDFFKYYNLDNTSTITQKKAGL